MHSLYKPCPLHCFFGPFLPELSICKLLAAWAMGWQEKWMKHLITRGERQRQVTEYHKMSCFEVRTLLMNVRLYESWHFQHGRTSYGGRDWKNGKAIYSTNIAIISAWLVRYYATLYSRQLATHKFEHGTSFYLYIPAIQELFFNSLLAETRWTLC